MNGFHRVGATKSGYKDSNYIISGKCPIVYVVVRQFNLQMGKNKLHFNLFC